MNLCCSARGLTGSFRRPKRAPSHQVDDGFRFLGLATVTCGSPLRKPAVKYRNDASSGFRKRTLCITRPKRTCETHSTPLEPITLIADRYLISLEVEGLVLSLAVGDGTDQSIFLKDYRKVCWPMLMAVQRRCRQKRDRARGLPGSSAPTFAASPLAASPAEFPVATGDGDHKPSRAPRSAGKSFSFARLSQDDPQLVSELFSYVR